MSQSGISSIEYNTKDQVPGTPLNQVQIFKHIYRYVQIYRQRHDGIYPSVQGRISDLLNDIGRTPSAYGFADYGEYFKTTVNPDNQYSDVLFIRQRPDIATSPPPSLRPDGSLLGSPKPKGTRDLLSSTDIYYHRNPLITIRKSNPVGYYMVPWDDGSIEKIAYDQIFYLAKTGADGQNYIIVYPTQAGVSWNCLTYEEYETERNPQTTLVFPPIGYPFAPGQTYSKPDNGGIESLVALTRLFDRQYDREQIWDSLGHQVKDFTLQEVADGAAKINFPLQKKTISLDELQKLHTPAVLYLSDAGRIVTMSTIDDNHAIIYDHGMTLNVSRAELAKRYGGEALIAASVNAPSSLVVDQPIRTLEFSSKDAEVTQNVKITNHGAKPISLLIERPLCGINRSEIVAG
jgi:hypothetical protein